MIALVRNVMTTESNGLTRLYFECGVLEAGGFSPGDKVEFRVEQHAVVLLKRQDGDSVISKRQRAGWKEPRPYFDRKNQELTRVLHARKRIDIIVHEGRIEARLAQSISLWEIGPDSFQGAELKRLRCFSIPSGAGIANAALQDTGLYECVGGVDFWNAAADTFRLNFGKSGVTLWSDIRHIHSEFVPQADVAWLSCECDEFSSLGRSYGGSISNLAPHYVRLVNASSARTVIIEQVPQFYSSRSYRQLLSLLQASGFRRFYETMIDAHEFGSIPSRVRGYAVAFKDDIDFEWPTAPNIPVRFRSTIGQVIGRDWEVRGNFQPIEGTYMSQILAKDGNTNNFTAKHNHTLVSLESNRMSAILESYSRTNVTSSYFLHPDGNRWRKFIWQELARFLHIPSWFQFPKWMSENQITQLIGQSVDCNVVKAIGGEVAVSLMKLELGKKFQSAESYLQEKKGQLSFLF
ncbi:DNA cytosine methyltransferase [Paenibacillus sp. WQ 127069]|uniref:DNA (cytosine-5-)-methyltransferase n=1 Tax=Paenibacillus baimaensis TaxID=2982185 RepID=A0ABT2UFE4_9BACL|nr:DNA cytosine methyltransferase [Paenibacillus sp. WQ 127069]MCU6793330.1 DNA cytosine methyltransferase [Paenibacillus sp. WQ 127069]